MVCRKPTKEEEQALLAHGWTRDDSSADDAPAWNHSTLEYQANTDEALTVLHAERERERRAVWSSGFDAAGAAMHDAGDWNNLNADEMASDAARYADEKLRAFDQRFPMPPLPVVIEANPSDATVAKGA